MNITVITKNGEYNFASKKSALMYVRDIIRMERRAYRKAHNLTDNVDELPPAEKTGIALVDMASYKLSNMGAQQLEELLNDYGYFVKIRKVEWQVAWSEKSGLLHTVGTYATEQEAQAVADKINSENRNKWTSPLCSVTRMFKKL